MQKQISILGCGWLGLPLAKHLSEKGFKINGSTTSEDKLAVLKEKNIHPFLLKISENEIEGNIEAFLESSEIVYINFPPRRIPNIEEIYPKQLQLILNNLKPVQKIIFISSTSVYQNTNGTVTEDLEIKPEKASGVALQKCEAILQNLPNPTTIIRFAGLVGADRLPGRFLANKTNLKNGNAPINVIHLEDCIGLIEETISQNYWNKIINGCADEHPLRKEYYTLAAKKIGLTPPLFAEEESCDFKIISNQKSKNDLNYTYKFPNPLDLL
ncbi:NAD(P)-binding domain-containing protein [Aureivirga sp. CE67]|uniref:NAD(P)-binding domain-containing protein n=1 Tax=Aureivirga sp. CE67 TaxID=1788983 RepID=UPI0018CB5096|nr:NAD(P)-binding domain-containing protein [Aureivirga sp. CE67]